MRNASESEINDVFDRINSFGRRLSDQERRQAGVQNDFSELVRTLACQIRNDVSHETLPLYQMHSISIDLPKTNHGYAIQADDVFWVNQGIIRSTDLRDSLDEQCIADIAACIIGGTLIERTKDALDRIYDSEDPECHRILEALTLYGREVFLKEFKYCVQEIILVCACDSPKKLRDIIYSRKRTNNSFTTVFSVILIAFQELFKEGLKIADYSGVKRNLDDLSSNIETGRDAIQTTKRRDNIEFLKNKIKSSFIEAENSQLVYSDHTISDIRNILTRSCIELEQYELKQGILNLDEHREINQDVFQQVINTIAAMANSGPIMAPGKIIIGVANKAEDADLIARLDRVRPIPIGSRSVVGVNREAAALGIGLEDYIGLWLNKIRESALSISLIETVKVDFHNYYTLGVIIITIPAQTELSYSDRNQEIIHKRVDDKTRRVTKPSEIQAIVQRFPR